MKKLIILATILILLIPVPAVLFAEGAVETIPQIETVEQQESAVVLPSDLSLEEYNGLILMREEEKLARDVYMELGDIWGIRIFTNIANSEQTHMEAVLTVMETYGIDDPILDDTRGLFTNPELADLYDQLIEKGSASLTDAFIVGAIIEDLDIKDLRVLLSETDKENITRMYENLEKGSENHIRSFVRQIEINGSSYEAQFITAEELAEILGK
ncbi:MAG: DUF2202 domain-containing protein [Spirochaetales bacterium]|nr:DUF2202 domain-containing protein [Spirochaetales bacterium]